MKRTNTKYAIMVTDEDNAEEVSYVGPFATRADAGNYGDAEDLTDGGYAWAIIELHSPEVTA